MSKKLSVAEINDRSQKLQVKHVQNEGKPSSTEFHEHVRAQAFANFGHMEAANNSLKIGQAAQQEKVKENANTRAQILAHEQARAKAEALAREQNLAKEKAETKAREMVANNEQIQRLMQRNKDLLN